MFMEIKCLRTKYVSLRRAKIKYFIKERNFSITYESMIGNLQLRGFKLMKWAALTNVRQNDPT